MTEHGADFQQILVRWIHNSIILFEQLIKTTESVVIHRLHHPGLHWISGDIIENLTKVTFCLDYLSMSPIDPEMPLAVESFVKHFGENAENPPHNIRDITALGGFNFDMHMVVHYAILSVSKAVTLFDTLEDFFEHQLDFISFQNVLLEVCPGCYVIVCSGNFWLNFSHT